MPVEELDVGVEVLVEVPSDHERPADRPDRVHAEREQEQDSGPQPAAGQSFERAQNVQGLRRRWTSWPPSSAAARNDTCSSSFASSRRTYSAGWYALQRLVPAERS